MKTINFKRKTVRFFNVAFVLLLLSCSGGDDSPETPDPEPEVDKPVAQADVYTTVENEAITFDDLLDNDTIFDFGRVSEIDAESAKGGTVIDNRDGSYTYTPPSNFIGEDTFEYTLCDASIPVNCSSTTVTVTVTGAEPVAVDDNYEVEENNSLVLKNFIDNDELLDNATVSSIDITGLEGSAVLNTDGTITYTAPNGFTGEDTFTYDLCDDDATPNCSTATITMKVVDEGTPVAVDDEFVFKKDNQTITIQGYTDNDDLIDDAVVTEINYSGSGSAVLNSDGTITYIPQANFIGEETITYTLCDDDEVPSCDTATITVKLVEVLDFNIPANLEYYYEDVAFTTDPHLDFTVLQKLTKDMHTTVLEYTQRHDFLYDVDEDPSNAANVILVYSGESRDRREWSSSSNSHTPQTFNTEHIYPQSLFNRDPVIKGDLHHLRTADDAVNSLRSNYPYTDGSGSYKLVNDNSFYPGDEWKGDVARMILYLNVRYDLSVDKVGTLDLFLKWNREDPVSNFERRRNGVIEEAQGNRNPFIDNPYLATLIWGGTPAENTWE